MADEIYAYAEWRLGVERSADIAEPDKEDLVKPSGMAVRNSESLAVQLRKDPSSVVLEKFNIMHEDFKSFKAPEPQKLKLFNKMKEVQGCHEDLEASKARHKDKMGEFSKRLEDIARRKDEIKENFIRYNNIVKDKHRKVADEMSKYMIEKTKRPKQTQALKQGQKNMEFLYQLKDMLNEVIDSKEVYNKYLESVVDESNGKFSDVQNLMDKIIILIEIKENLKEKLCRVESKTKLEKEIHEKYIEDTHKKFLVSNVTIPLLQRDYQGTAATTLTKRRELYNKQVSRKCL